MKRHFLPVLLVACMLIVAVWLLMARQSSQPFKPFDLTARDFVGFQPSLPGWLVRSIPVSTNDPAEPNIAAYVVESDKGQAVSGKREDGKDSPLGTAAPTLPTNSQSRLPGAPPVFLHSDTFLPPHVPSPLPLTALTRLVHGYNMPMCMKIKGYTVVPMADHRGDAKELSGSQVAGNKPGDSTGDSSSSPKQPSNITTQQPAFSSSSSDSDTPTHSPRALLPHQLWRVTSSDGARSIWVTTMIRAGDFFPTGDDICSMAFPRVDVADDPRWMPRGFAWADLRHPVANLRRWVQARWNASRTDLLTFLRLRQPAWASEELLTYVTRSASPDITDGNENDVASAVVAAHAEMLKALQAWRFQQSGMK